MSVRSHHGSETRLLHTLPDTAVICGYNSFDTGFLNLSMVGTAGMALILAVFWRLITYYLYLLIGALVVPSWLSKTIDRIRK